MKKLFLASLSLAALSAPTLANESLGVSLSNLSDDGITLQTLNVHAGYTFYLSNPNFSITPEGRLGLGVGDDQIGGVDVEVDSLMVLSVRANYSINEKVVIFAQPSYAKLRASAQLANNSGAKESLDSDWELGAGVGAEYKINPNCSLNLTYENIENTDILSAGFRYNF